MRGGLEIAIVGAGVAGLAAAALLARAGHRPLLFERFGTAQPVGSGLLLQPTGQAVLGELGLLTRAEEAGQAITRLCGKAGGRTVLAVDYAALGAGQAAIGIHRARLFDLLAGAAAAAGVPLVTGWPVAAVDGRSLVAAEGRREGPFDLIVDAAGSLSPLADVRPVPLPFGALWGTVEWRDGADLDPHALSQRYRAASEMAGLLPLGDGRVALFWSLRGDAVERWRHDGMCRWHAAWQVLWPETVAFAGQLIEPSQLTFARYCHRTRRSPVNEHVLHLGDSWHSTSPQLGQGANMALLDAFALTQALDQPTLADALAAFLRMRRGHVRLYQALSRLLTPVYQSDGWVIPALRDWAVGPLSGVWPVPQLQARLVAGLIGDPLGALGLSPPGARR